MSPLGSTSLFGTGGLAFQLGFGEEDMDEDYEVDPDLITVSERKWAVFFTLLEPDFSIYFDFSIQKDMSSKGVWGTKNFHIQYFIN